jgi:hypothetical protein
LLGLFPACNGKSQHLDFPTREALDPQLENQMLIVDATRERAAEDADAKNIRILASSEFGFQKTRVRLKRTDIGMKNLPSILILKRWRRLRVIDVERSGGQLRDLLLVPGSRDELTAQGVMQDMSSTFDPHPSQDRRNQNEDEPLAKRVGRVLGRDASAACRRSHTLALSHASKHAAASPQTASVEGRSQRDGSEGPEMPVSVRYGWRTQR